MIRDLRKGDIVRTSAKDGDAAVVRCIVRTPCATGEDDLVTLPGGLRVTPWHPVRMPGEAKWRFPARDFPDAVRNTAMPCEAVYSVLLDSGSMLTIDGYEGIALGHSGFENDAVAAHPFFGNEAAITAALSSMRGWSDGLVVRELDR